FVNAHIHGPTFDLQTKEKLTANDGSFGSTCKLTPEFLKKIADSLFEDLSKKKKSNAGKLDIPKLQDAKLADTPYSQQCTLILTDADFATDFVMSGLGQYIAKYGVFPLEGNLLNVREASPQELEKNTDIQNIKKILGLQDGKIYENVKELRYGHLMIVVNEVCTLTMRSQENQFNITFYQELETIDSEGGGGEYNFDQHIKDFVWDNEEDGDAIERAFSNKKIEEREHWLKAPLKVWLLST
nr:DNA topoisomerase 2 [Tanacetum cinerariifolium]